MMKDPVPNQQPSATEKPRIEKPKNKLTQTIENFYAKIENPNTEMNMSISGAVLGLSGEIKITINPRFVEGKTGYSLQEILIEDLRITLTPEEASNYLPDATNEQWVLSYNNAALIAEIDAEGYFGERTTPGFSTLTPEKGGIAITNSSKVPQLDDTLLSEIINQVSENL